MGSSFNFKGFENDPTQADGGGGYQSPLARQPSIFALTFEEFQNTIGGGLGKDFGSMNMDELLKNICSAEETQTTAASGYVPAAGTPLPEGLQRQGSLTLPRTLSLRTVDEVWNDISMGLLGGNSLSTESMGVASGAATTQRQQTLGEITLEEFLVRAGVVRDHNPTAELSLNGGIGGGYIGNGSVAIDFGQDSKNIMPSRPVLAASSPVPSSVNGVGSNHEQSHLPRQLQSQHQPPQILPKQGALRCTAPFQSSPDMEIGNQGRPCYISSVHQMSSDGVAKGNGVASSILPTPYEFNGGLRGRRLGGKVEKVAERRQRRMIKNRESAARSRARKQAYTIELEAEVAKLKEENEELRKKEAELKHLHKHQATEIVNTQQGGRKRSLRRTYTGPW